MRDPLVKTPAPGFRTGSQPRERRRHGQPAPTVPPRSSQRSTNISGNAAAAPVRRDPHRSGFSRDASIPPDGMASGMKSGRSTVIADGNREGNDGSHQRPEAAAVNSHLLSRI